MKRKAVKIFSISLVVLVCVGFAIFAFLAKISEIHCKTQFGDCPIEYTNRLSYLIGQKMWPKPDINLARESLASYPEVANVIFVASFFNELNILVEQRSPIGIVGNLAVDQAGIAFPISSDSALPVLQTAKTYTAGNKVSDEDLAALRVLGELSHLSLGAFSSKLQAAVLTITVNTGLEIIFDVHNVPNSWPDSLQLIFARSKIDAKVPQKIDLRFRDPVVTYK